MRCECANRALGKVWSPALSGRPDLYYPWLAFYVCVQENQLQKKRLITSWCSAQRVVYEWCASFQFYLQSYLNWQVFRSSFSQPILQLWPTLVLIPLNCMTWSVIVKQWKRVEVGTMLLKGEPDDEETPRFRDADEVRCWESGPVLWELCLYPSGKNGVWWVHSGIKVRWSSVMGRTSLKGTAVWWWCRRIFHAYKDPSHGVFPTTVYHRTTTRLWTL